MSKLRKYSLRDQQQRLERYCQSKNYVMVKHFQDRAATKLVNDELDKEGYGRLKERIVKENVRLRSQIADLKATETGYQEYSRYGLSMLANLSKCYESASFEYRQRMIGLMFPEKLVF